MVLPGEFPRPIPRQSRRAAAPWPASMAIDRRRLAALRRRAGGAFSRPDPARDAGSRGPSAARPGRARDRSRTRVIRPGRDRHPLRPGARAARRPEPRRARAARRAALSGERDRAAYRSLLDAEASPSLGELELPPQRRIGRPDDGHLRHEPPPAPARRPPLPRHPQPQRGDRSGAGDLQDHLRPSGPPRSRAFGPRDAGPRSAGAIAPTIAVPTGAGGFTRTAWSARCGPASGSGRWPAGERSRYPAAEGARRVSVRDLRGLGHPPPPGPDRERVPLSRLDAVARP